MPFPSETNKLSYGLNGITSWQIPMWSKNPLRESSILEDASGDIYPRSGRNEFGVPDDIATNGQGSTKILNDVGSHKGEDGTYYVFIKGTWASGRMTFSGTGVSSFSDANATTAVTAYGVAWDGYLTFSYTRPSTGAITITFVSDGLTRVAMAYPSFVVAANIGSSEVIKDWAKVTRKTYTEGEIHPEFLNDIKHVGAIRFMDAIFTNQGTHPTIPKPESGQVFGAHTAGATSVAISNFGSTEPEDGFTIEFSGHEDDYVVTNVGNWSAGQFVATISPALSQNVPATDTVEVKDGSWAESQADAAFDLHWETWADSQDGRVPENWFSWGEDKPKDGTVTNLSSGWGVPDYVHNLGGVPLEHCIAIANAAGVDVQFNIPCTASIDDDPTVTGGTTSFHAGFAAYCRDNLDVDLRVFIGCGNELWNTASSFHQWREVIQALAPDDGFTTSTTNLKGGMKEWLPYRTRKIAQLWRTVFNGTGASDPARFWPVIEGQADDMNYSEDLLARGGPAGDVENASLILGKHGPGWCLNAPYFGQKAYKDDTLTDEYWDDDVSTVTTAELAAGVRRHMDGNASTKGVFNANLSTTMGNVLSTVGDWARMVKGLGPWSAQPWITGVSAENRWQPGSYELYFDVTQFHGHSSWNTAAGFARLDDFHRTFAGAGDLWYQPRSDQEALPRFFGLGMEIGHIFVQRTRGNPIDANPNYFGDKHFYDDAIAGADPGWLPVGTRTKQWAIDEGWYSPDAAVEVPVADFTAVPTSGTGATSVDFFSNAAGVGIDAWEWEFLGSGVSPATSTAQFPENVVYPNATANYTVRHRAHNSAGWSDWEEKTAYISITAASDPPPATTVGVYTSASTANNTPEQVRRALDKALREHASPEAVVFPVRPPGMKRLIGRRARDR